MTNYLRATPYQGHQIRSKGNQDAIVDHQVFPLQMYKICKQSY